ncbi:hypothetical protein ACIBH1_32015 [Nonomuraea sp. NPDC050663]|uniref:hypothetical protein n=1 Tax=Nonomuraea sp. NPDC050663 TaxID=3364370 RepID=UPI0037A1AC3A
MSSTRPWPSLIAASALAVICAVAAVVAANVAASELTRGPTLAELESAADGEVAERWRTWPSGRIFPSTLVYTAEQGGEEKAKRVGISPATGCTAAVDKKARKALSETGCRAALKATYLDALGGVVVTVGVLVLPDELRAERAASLFSQGGDPVPGLRALAFKSTVADRFTDAGRQAGSVRQAGPYVVMTTAGQVDGRTAKSIGGSRPSIFAFASELGERVLAALSRPGVPACGEQEWQC